MVKKYLDFINEESYIILESDVIYSDKFRKAINKIDHPISKSLIDIENKDLDVRNNYFDISIGTNDRISFIPDSKAQEIINDDKKYYSFNGSGRVRHSDANSDIFNRLGYEPVGDSSYSPNSNEIGEEISRADSNISSNTYVYVKFKDGEGVYNLNGLREREPIDGVWTKNRQEIKIGKGVKSILKSSDIEFSPKELEDYVNLFKSTIDIMSDKFSNFEVVDGDKIAHWYKRRNYHKNAGSSTTGTLGTSCMAGVPSSYFDIYVKNPEVCKLIIMKSPDDGAEIIARALLWKLKDGKMFMDRVYTINDSDVNLFKEYAKENGWYAKYYNNSSADSDAKNPQGERVDLDIEVQLGVFGYNDYPYMDTLKFYNDSEDTLSINSTYSTATLESTDGNAMDCEDCEGSRVVTCGECNGNGECRCEDCDGEGDIDCNECDGEGESECGDCDGTGSEECDECIRGKIECVNCDGSGEYDDEDCEDCDGEGESDCEDCDGEGHIECRRCDGESTIKCNDCSGRGSKDCENCYSGYVECSDCGGDGEVSCYECS